jgi:hypothetical protein
MARLTIQNIAAPELSGVSSILNNAANSLNTGLSNASNLLDSYTKGQQEKADSAILGQIAGISSEDELAKFINSGELEKAPLSPEMRQTVLDLRKNILANNQTKANIGLTNANTGSVSANTRIRQAAEGRTAAEYADSVASRDALRALTPYTVGAALEGNTLGEARGPDGNLLPSEASQPAFNNLSEAIKASVKVDPAQAQAILSNAYEAQKFGQARIDDRNQRVRNETSATAILNAAKDTGNILPRDITKTLINDPTIANSNDRISAILRADELAKGPISEVISPTPAVPIPEVIRNSVELFKEREIAALDASVQNRLAHKVKQFRADPTKSLIEDLKLSNDGENPTSYLFGFLSEDYDELNITRQINEIARKENVSSSVVATAMSEIFRRDPIGFNTTKARFDPDEVRSYIKNDLSQDALARYEKNRVVTESKDREVNRLVLQLNTARSRALKYDPDKVPETLAKQIDNLEKEILTQTNTPVLQSGSDNETSIKNSSKQDQLLNYISGKGFTEKIQQTPIGSPERRNSIESLKLIIKSDSSLNSTQKKELLSAIEE